MTKAASMSAACVPEVSAQAYRQLRVLARARLRDGGRETLLDTTALVHEAYLRFAGVEHAAEQRSFLAYCEPGRCDR